MSPCRDVPQPEYSPSRRTMWLLSAGGGASGEGTATAAGTGTGAGAGVGGVTGAGAGAGVATAGAGTDAVGVGGGALAVGDCAATVDSAWTNKAERSGFRFARGAPAEAWLLDVAADSGAGATRTGAGDVGEPTVTSPVGAVPEDGAGRRASPFAICSAAPRVRA